MIPHVLFAAVVASLFTRGLGPIHTGRTARAQLSQSVCTKCHEAISTEWQHSRHGQSWTDPTFQREYRQQPLAWCVHCHAPLDVQFQQVKQNGPGGGPLTAEGVSCAVCHVRDGRILSAERRPGSPHKTLVQKGFGDADYCAGCHQFNFPIVEPSGAVRRYSPHPMQDTVAQFRLGPYGKGGTCRDCHARTPGGHLFPGAHDLGMLRQALKVDLCRRQGNVEVTVRNSGAGHNVPTGDVHRHLVLRLWRAGAPERLNETVFGRRYEPAGGGGKKTVSDTTLRPGESRRVVVPIAGTGGVAGPAGGKLRMELRYVYTIDEFPLPGQQLGEPTFQIVEERREESGFPVCK